jgi:hypothetical protein
MAHKRLLTKSWILVSLTAIILFATVGLPLIMLGQGNMGNMGNRWLRGNLGGMGPPVPVIPAAVPADVRIRQSGCWVEMSLHMRECDYTVERVIWYIDPNTQVELIYNWRSRRWEGSICLQNGTYHYTFRAVTDDGIMWRIPQDDYWKCVVQ